MSNPTGKGIEMNGGTRLCSIYLRDVLSLLELGDVNKCAPVSMHCDDTIKWVGADKLPRRVFDFFTIQESLYFNERFQPGHHFYTWEMIGEMGCRPKPIDSPFLSTHNCHCDGELLTAAAKHLINVRINLDLLEDDELVKLRVRCNKWGRPDSSVTFWARNRVERVESAFQLLHLLTHIRDAHILFKYAICPRLNPTILGQLSVLSGGIPFRPHLRSMSVWLEDRADIGEQLERLQCLYHLYEFEINDLGLGEKYAKQVFNIVTGTGRVRPNELHELRIYTWAELDPNFFDRFTELLSTGTPNLNSCVPNIRIEAYNQPIPFRWPSRWMKAGGVGTNTHNQRSHLSQSTYTEYLFRNAHSRQPFKMGVEQQSISTVAVTFSLNKGKKFA